MTLLGEKVIMKEIIFSILFFAAQSTFAQTSAQDRFSIEEKYISELVVANKLSVTEGAKEIWVASKIYFPNDTLTHAFYESVLDYAQRLDKKQITQKQALDLLNAREARFREAIRMRDEENEKQKQHRQKAIDEENMQRDMLARQILDEQRRNQAIGTMLQGVGNAFRNAYPQPNPRTTTNCNSYVYGGQLMTNCQ